MWRVKGAGERQWFTATGNTGTNTEGAVCASPENGCVCVSVCDYEYEGRWKHILKGRTRHTARKMSSFTCSVSVCGHQSVTFNYASKSLTFSLALPQTKSVSQTEHSTFQQIHRVKEWRGNLMVTSPTLRKPSLVSWQVDFHTWNLLKQTISLLYNSDRETISDNLPLRKHKIWEKSSTLKHTHHRVWKSKINK